MEVLTRELTIGITRSWKSQIRAYAKIAIISSKALLKELEGAVARADGSELEP